jgi:uncharacterized protein (TIGR03067 family)
MIIRVVLGSLAIALLLGADEPAKDVKMEMELLQGEWMMISEEAKGETIPEAIVSKTKLTIKGDKWATETPLFAGAVSTSIAKLDPSKDPKEIDLKPFGENKHEAIGIYKLEGDTLTICANTSKETKERPKEFKTTSESGILAVWKRVKK